MSITVRELVEMPSLRTRFLAGKSGGDRQVLWAHPTELPEPWNWLGSGDLFLTNGLSMPREPAEQVTFVEDLNNAGLAGIALGEGPHAPEVSTAALEVADHLGFPILATAYSMPWVALVRVVVERGEQRGHRRIAKILRSYDIFRRAHGSTTSPRQLLTELGEEAECLLHVLAVPSGRSLLPTESPLAAAQRDAVTARIAAVGVGSLPAFSRVGASFMLPVAENTAVLIATPHSARTDVDLMVLQHAATIVGLEVERRSFAHIRKREQGSQLLQQLLTGTIDTEAAAEQLSRFQLAERPWRVLSWAQGSLEHVVDEDPVTLLATNSVPHLVWESDEQALTLVSDAMFERLAWLFAERTEPIGVSHPLHRLNRMRDAAQEANWARTAGLGSAHHGYRVYGEGTSPFQPRTITEGEVAVDTVLGAVIEHDREQGAHLMQSLVAYFDANRTWQDAADRLGVHRQTLIYRVGQIEKLTGRRMQDLADQTELYLAVQAWKALQP